METYADAQQKKARFPAPFGFRGTGPRSGERGMISKDEPALAIITVQD
jgi:hypothetical protein